MTAIRIPFNHVANIINRVTDEKVCWVDTVPDITCVPNHFAIGDVTLVMCV